MMHGLTNPKVVTDVDYCKWMY